MVCIQGEITSVARLGVQGLHFTSRLPLLRPSHLHTSQLFLRKDAKVRLQFLWWFGAEFMIACKCKALRGRSITL